MLTSSCRARAAKGDTVKVERMGPGNGNPERVWPKLGGEEQAEPEPTVLRPRLLDRFTEFFECERFAPDEAGSLAESLCDYIRGAEVSDLLLFECSERLFALAIPRANPYDEQLRQRLLVWMKKQKREILPGDTHDLVAAGYELLRGIENYIKKRREDPKEAKGPVCYRQREELRKCLANFSPKPAIPPRGTNCVE